MINDVVTPFVSGNNGTAAATDNEVLVFFRKMEGDYNRYGAEITTDDTRLMYKQRALAAYKVPRCVVAGCEHTVFDFLCCVQAAQELASTLASTNPIRLGLALNFSVFYYEICEEKVEACDLAKNAFDTAIDQLDQLSEEAYKDSTLIMQLLKDNLTLWTAQEEDSDDLEVQEVEDM